MFNEENDRWFLEKVRCGTLIVQNNGTVFNSVTGRFIGAVGSGRYPKISMMERRDENGKAIIRNMQIHRLVWIVFRGPIPHGMEINHRDANKLNPALENLELTTPKQNVAHAFAHGLMESSRPGKRKDKKAA